VDHDADAVQASLLGDAAWRKSSYSSPSGNCVEAAGGRLSVGGVRLGQHVEEGSICDWHCHDSDIYSAARVQESATMHWF
jgi:Domain of unknown function (DUF397)